VRAGFPFTSLLWLLLLATAGASPASAQLQLAAIHGVVLDVDGAAVAGAIVDLTDPLGSVIASRSADSSGRFTFASVAPGRYALRIALSQWQPIEHALTIEAALPVEVTLRLSLRTSVDVVVEESGTPGSPARRTAIAGDSITQVPLRTIARGVQDVIATLPGWATEDNGLLHVRGTDDGFLYVIDGVPVYERLDQLNGLGPDLITVESINVITGYIPAEFGYKAGGVIDVRSKSLVNDWLGTVQVEQGTERDTTGAASAAGKLSSTLTVTVAASAQRSDRFLDPVHPDNLHNHGDVAGGSGQLTWTPSAADILTANVAAGRIRYDVPNTEAQEAASQAQRQRVGRAYAAVSWQRVWSASTVSQLSAYLRRSDSMLTGSASDTPVFADAHRTLARAGAIAGVSRRLNSHTVKGGFEFQRLDLEESFLFAVTDLEEAEEAGLSQEAIEHDAQNPFSFSGHDAPVMWSVFLQDEWTATNRLTLSGGVRFDESRLGLRRRQLSPRGGAAFRAAPGTVLRGSVSRFFQPPQPENLLLSTSDQAWELSPFADEEAEGGADLEPERQWAFEAGINQQLGPLFSVDAAVWRRSVFEAADPNVFGGTTIIFPNAVARGRAAGLDVRVEMPRRRSWSGYLNLSIGAVRQNGPITGGLFLEDDVAEVASGDEFIPDHDQLVVASGGVTWMHARSRASISATLRYESGTPLERGDEDEAKLRERPGSERVDFDRGRVAPRTIASLLADIPVWKRGRRSASIRASVLNLLDDRYAYNFGNPFSGTHFGAPRTLSVAARLAF
jgi:outer membrane receptor protein involved in Fe transport